MCYYYGKEDDIIKLFYFPPQDIVTTHVQKLKMSLTTRRLLAQRAAHTKKLKM